jgi:hypothetical protein
MQRIVTRLAFLGAACVGHAWQPTVAGGSVVVIYDARRATITRADAAVPGGDGRMHVLPAGSGVEPKSGRVALPR